MFFYNFWKSPGLEPYNLARIRIGKNEQKLCRLFLHIYIRSKFLDQKFLYENFTLPMLCAYVWVSISIISCYMHHLKLYPLKNLKFSKIDNFVLRRINFSHGNYSSQIYNCENSTCFNFFFENIFHVKCSMNYETREWYKSFFFQKSDPQNYNICQSARL